MTFIKLVDLTNEQAIEQTKSWIKTVVIGCNFCPFAAKAYFGKTIHYVVNASLDIDQGIAILKEELEGLDQHPERETSFIIFTEGFKNFKEYLLLVKKADKLLVKEGYEGTYQVASFHPQYCFQGSEQDDPANYTNRSVYAMLHLLREESIDKALKFFPNPEKIPENNIAYAQKKGLQYMQLLLSSCE